MSLQSFGIPATQLPLTVSGEVKTDGHREMLEKRRRQERTIQKTQYVGVPAIKDVVFGRGYVKGSVLWLI